MSNLRDIIDPEWAAALEPVATDIAAMGDFLREENAAGRGYLPAGANVLRAFTYPLSKVRVLIVGQDPYPTPGHPIGLSFAVDSDVRPLPRSLTNIYRELNDDLGIPPAEHGDLTAWSERGVMLLNRVLTVQRGLPASHRGKELKPLLGATSVITSPHPSPLSASRGFFGSKPFSRTNALLVEQGAEPIDWSV